MEYPSIALNVYLVYQGRSEIRHRHVFTYEESQLNNFSFDNDEKSLDSTIQFINQELS